MTSISYSMFKELKRAPCSRIRLLFKEIGKEGSVSFEDLLNFPWLLTSDISYLYQYNPSVFSDEKKLESNLKKIGFILTKKLYPIFPHPIIDEFDLQYSKDGKITDVLEHSLIKVSRGFRTNVIISSLFNCIFTLITPDYALPHVDYISSQCSSVLGPESLLLTNNPEIKKLLL